MSEVNENTRVPFGRFERGKRLRDCSDAFLNWIMNHLQNDVNLQVFAYAAKKVLSSRAAGESEMAAVESLEDQADAILRNAGHGSLCSKNRSRRH